MGYKNMQVSNEILESIQSINSTTRRNIIFLITVKTSVALLYDHSTLRQALEKMKHHGFTALPVITEDGTYVGTVSEGDFLWHILDCGECTIKSQEDYPISDILRGGWNPAVKIDVTMDELLLRVMDQNFVPVVDDRDKFIGIITRKSVIKYYHGISEKTASRKTGV
jgi:CBS domain-containing protein